MIALCAEHHDKADAGAFTDEQLRALKLSGRQRAEEVRGSFDWMRRDLLGVVGTNFFYETPTLVAFRNDPMIWFNRDEDGYLLLNVRMLTVSGQPRMRVEDSFWLVRGEPSDIESPPSGKRLRIRYANGDELGVEFFELADAQAAGARYGDLSDPTQWPVVFPITAVEVSAKVGERPIEFGPRKTTLRGLSMRGTFTKGCTIGLAFD
jgi:hypothetical protein